MPKGTSSRENFGGDISEAKGSLSREISNFKKGQIGHKWGGRSHQQVKMEHYPEVTLRLSLMCVCGV